MERVYMVSGLWVRQNMPFEKDIDKAVSGSRSQAWADHHRCRGCAPAGEAEPCSLPEILRGEAHMQADPGP